MADTSLIFNIIARDKTTVTLEKIKAAAGSTGAVIARTLGPALIPVLGVANGAVLALGASFAAAGAGAGVFGAVAKTAMTEVTEAAKKYDTLSAKVKQYGEMAKLQKAAGEDNTATLKKQAAAQLQLQAAMKGLPPETRRATEAYLDLKEAWTDFVDQNKPETFGIMESGMQLAGLAVNKLQPFFDAGAAAAKRLVAAVTPLVMGNGLDTLGKRAGPALKTLTNIIINVATAVGRTFGAFASDGQGILDWIEKATKKWADWSNVKAGGGLQKFVDYFHKQGPGVVTLLTNLAQAAIHIAQAVTPLAPVSFAIATALSKLISIMPPSLITALVAGWIAFGIAVKLYAVGSAIATAAQWAMNSAFLASPITWIVIAIIALAAGIYWVATRTRFFQTIWHAVWGFMKGVGAWFAGPFAGFFVSMWHKIVGGLVAAKNGFMTAVNFIKNLVMGWVNLQVRAVSSIINGIVRVINFVRTAPGRMAGALRNMFAPLWSGFRNFVNRIIGGWNRLSFGIPGFSFAGISVPGISIGTPNIPYLATGGDIRSDGLIYAHKGERMTKAAQVTRTGPGAGSGGGTPTLVIRSDGSKVSRLLLELLRESIRDKGGDPVKVLTPA